MSYGLRAIEFGLLSQWAKANVGLVSGNAEIIGFGSLS